MTNRLPSSQSTAPASPWRTTWRRLWKYVRAEWSGVAVLPRARIGRYLWFIILLLGIGLRVGGLDWGLSYTQAIGPPHHDEPHVMHFLTIPWEEFKKQFHEYEIVRPVYFWRVIARPLFTLGEQVGWNSPENLVYEYAVPRAINSVFGIIGLLVIYALGVRLGGTRAGLLAMALLAVTPGHWYYSQLLKGDLLVTTYDALLLLCAIRIYDRGSRFWYLLAGLTAGISLASKPSVVVVLPVVLLAHVLRAVSTKKMRLLIGRNVWLTLAVAIISFTLLYPYPFIDAERWWTVLTEPTSQDFQVVWLPTPQSFLASWQDYNEPPNVFMEMVFGEALRVVFPVTAALFIVLTALAWRAKKGMAYLLTIVAAFLIYHSLSFSPPLDDRYALPLATFVVLFPAVLAGRLSFAPSQWRVWVATCFALVLLVYTAGVTWVMFPLFAFGTDIRVAATQWLEATIKPGDIIGEFEALGRQSLPFDRNRVVTTRVRSHEEDPHMFLFSEPDYFVLPVEPTNYDHAFRYQIYTPALKEEFPEYLRSFTHLRRFGQQPEIFGRQLPRMLSTPIFDIYRYTGRASNPVTQLNQGETWQTLAGERHNPRTPLTFAAPLVLVSNRQIPASEIQGKLVTFTFDLSDIQAQRQREKLGKGTFMPFFFFDGQVKGITPEAETETDISLRQDAHRFGVIIPLRHNELLEQERIRVAFYFRPSGRIDVYTSQHGRLVGRSITSPRTFSTVQPAVALASESPMAAQIRLIDLTIEAPE